MIGSLAKIFGSPVAKSAACLTAGNLLTLCSPFSKTAQACYLAFNTAIFGSAALNYEQTSFIVHWGGVFWAAKMALTPRGSEEEAAQAILFLFTSQLSLLAASALQKNNATICQK